MWHYRKRFVYCSETGKWFQNIDQVSDFFRVSKYRLHKLIVNNYRLFDKFTLLYKKDCCVSVTKDNGENNQGGLPENSSRKRPLEEPNQSKVPTSRMRVDRD